MDAAVSLLLKELPDVKAKLVGFVCDVSHHDDLERLCQFAVEQLTVIDFWINNAYDARAAPTASGRSSLFRRCSARSDASHAPLTDRDPADICRVVETNLLGAHQPAKPGMRSS